MFELDPGVSQVSNVLISGGFVIFDRNTINLVLELLRPDEILTLWLYEKYLIFQYIKIVNGFVDVLFNTDDLMYGFIIVHVSLYQA